MKNIKKTIPSQDLRISWLAGIIDGEGSIKLHKLKNQNSTIVGVIIVNTDEGILSEIEIIYKDYGIFYSKYNRALYNKDYSFKSKKPCFEIVVGRKHDSSELCKLVIPYLKGIKKERAQLLVDYIKAHPVPTAKVKTCIICQKQFTSRGIKYCSLTCWHKYAVGKNNPNYKSGVTTE